METRAAQPYSLLKMTWPIFIELSLQILVGNVDQVMLSRYNDTAVAAVGNANQIMIILLLAFTVINLAATILISRYVGAKDTRSVQQIYVLSACTNFLLGIALCLLIYIMGMPLLRLMRMPDELIPEAIAYLRITALSLPFQALMFTFSAFLKAYAFMAPVTGITAIINVANILGNALLIYGIGPFPEMGASGAALSTTVCRVIGMVLMIACFFRRVPDARVDFSLLRPFPSEMFNRLLAIGLPSGGESLSYNFSQMAGLVFINALGTYVVTTRVYCVMFAQLCYMLISAVSQAGQIIISYHVGAQEFDVADGECRRILKIFTPITVGLTVLLYFASPVLFGLLTDDPRIIELGQKILLIEIVLEIGRCYNIVLVRGLQAVGDVRFPVFIGIASQWIVAVGLAYILCVPCKLGLIGMWIAFAIDENLRAVIFRIRWGRGEWKQRLML